MGNAVARRRSVRAQEPPGAGVATDLDVLRFQVDLENERAQLLRIKGSP